MMTEMVEHKCVCVHVCLIFDWFLAIFGRLTVNWDTDGWNYSVKNMQRWQCSAPNLKKATKSKRKCNQIHLLKSATRNIIFCLVDFGAPSGQERYKHQRLRFGSK